MSCLLYWLWGMVLITKCVLGFNNAGSAGDVLDDDPVGRLKVYVYELPSKYNKKLLQKDPRCLTHMFAAEIFMHRFLLSSPVRTLNPDEADWFYSPIYPTCDLTPMGLPLPFKSPRMMRSAIQLISSNWPYWNRTEGADHFFVVPHDFGACFHYQVGLLMLLDHTFLVTMSCPILKEQKYLDVINLHCTCLSSTCVSFLVWLPSFIRCWSCSLSALRCCHWSRN